MKKKTIKGWAVSFKDDNDLARNMWQAQFEIYETKEIAQKALKEYEQQSDNEKLKVISVTISY